MTRYVNPSEAKNIAKFIKDASPEEVEQLKQEISELSNANELYLAVTAELFELLKDDLLQEITGNVFGEQESSSEEVAEEESYGDEDDCDCDICYDYDDEDEEEEENLQDTILVSLQKQELSKQIAEQLAQQELVKSVAEQIAAAASIDAEPSSETIDVASIEASFKRLADSIKKQAEPQLLSSLIQQQVQEDKEEELNYGIEEFDGVTEPVGVLMTLDEVAEYFLNSNFDIDDEDELALDNETIDRLAVHFKGIFYYKLHENELDMVDYQEDFTAYILSKIAFELVEQGYELGFSVKDGSVVPTLTL